MLVFPLVFNPFVRYSMTTIDSAYFFVHVCVCVPLSRIHDTAVYNAHLQRFFPYAFYLFHFDVTSFEFFSCCCCCCFFFLSAIFIFLRCINISFVIIFIENLFHTVLFHSDVLCVWDSLWNAHSPVIIRTVYLKWNHYALSQEIGINIEHEKMERHRKGKTNEPMKYIYLLTEMRSIWSESW